MNDLYVAELGVSNMKKSISRLPKLLLRIWLGMVALSIILLGISVMTRSVRLLLLCTLCMTFVVIFERLRANRWVAGALVLVMLAGITWLMLPGRAYDHQLLSQEYARRLGSFEGVRYMWGGETHWGIDCSGLPRTALTEAMFIRGIKERNPQLLRMSWRHFWRDQSAAGMLNSRQTTRIIGSARKLAGYNPIDLQPGDMAITDRGDHVIVYFGDGRWIEAEPWKRVVISRAEADSTRAYFNRPVTFVRWLALE